ncbi:nuclear transport factor 2 family protein [Actinoplanes subglobosus]|uniref:Nuclear transport factor 2 family protein n=1 Tax=Actinoplanes subglobosus TaxID=1547892 RepID=A0ABV8IKF9_9ACTN
MSVVDALTRMLAEHECQRLLVEFLRRLDLGDPGSVAELFTPNGIWEWPDGDRLVRGRQELRAYFASRPADRMSRRLCTNVLIDVESPTRATGTSYLVTYRVDGYRGEMVPPPAPANVGQYEDVFEHHNGAWLLARRVTVLPFGGATPRL